MCGIHVKNNQDFDFAKYNIYSDGVSEAWGVCMIQPCRIVLRMRWSEKSAMPMYNKHKRIQKKTMLISEEKKCMYGATVNERSPERSRKAWNDQVIKNIVQVVSKD